MGACKRLVLQGHAQTFGITFACLCLLIYNICAVYEDFTGAWEELGAATSVVRMGAQGNQSLLWDPAVTCEGWAVATTIFEPSPAVMQLLGKGEICLVVVGDKKTNNSQWERLEQEFPKQLHFLSCDIQERLGYEIIRLTPWNHFARKNIGFLFAIQHGAHKIYDFDDDNMLKAEHALFDRIWGGPHHVQGVSTFESAHHLFNPYPLFVPMDEDGHARFVWPRGFPLEFIHDSETFNVSIVPDTTARIAVYQALADIDPDVDAIYRMTERLPVWFALQDAVLAVPPGTFAPWNAQATIFNDRAFFGLIMPVTVTGRVADIWRSYITERLLWIAGYQVAFTSSFVDQYRNPHSYHADFLAEKDLYDSVDHLLRTLIDLDVGRTTSLAEVYLQIVALLVQKGFLKRLDYALAHAWVQDLRTMGYVWPNITSARESVKQARQTPIVDHRKFVDKPSAKDWEPPPKRNNALPRVWKDTAVCVSGQIRTLNLSPSSPDFPASFQPMTTTFTAAHMQGRTVVSLPSLP
jgi:hypothetical protein